MQNTTIRERFMKTVTVKLFIHAGVNDKELIATNDMQKFGYALLGTYEVEVPVPELGGRELAEAKISALYEQAGEIEAEAIDKVYSLREEAKKLKGGINE